MDSGHDKAAKDARRAAGDPRMFLAAERTFLAWIRTGLALMGFGFILARFGVFLRQIEVLRGGSPLQPLGGSLWFGVMLVGIGVLVNIAATIRHVRFVHRLKEGRTDFNRTSKLAIAVALTLACVGVGTAAYLLIVSRSMPV